MRPGGGVLQTPGLAAFLTWKQAEMLVMLLEGGAQAIRDLSDLARHLLERDQAMGIRPMYWGVDDGSIRQCFAALERRELVRFDGEKWHLTPAGREAAESVR